MSLIYAAEPNALKARDRAFTLAEAQLAATADPEKKLKWMMTAVDAAYSPYLVQIHAMDGSMATISFVDCRTGEVMDEKITIDLNDRELVWNQLPSTLEGWSPSSTNCAFLFLSAKINDLTSIAFDSGGGTGKWPKGAAVTATAEQVRVRVMELIDQNPAALKRLLEHERRILREILAKLES